MPNCSFTYCRDINPNGVVGLRLLVAMLMAEKDVHTTASRTKKPNGSQFSSTHTANLSGKRYHALKKNASFTLKQNMVNDQKYTNKNKIDIKPIRATQVQKAAKDRRHSVCGPL